MPKKNNKKNTKEDLVKQIMPVIAEQSWEDFSISDVDGASDHFEDKADVLVVFWRMIDDQVLKNFSEVDLEISPRDQMFDILMDRYEVLNEYRGALVSILSSFKLDPKQIVISMPHLCSSMSAMLEAAGVDTSGIPGALKVTGATGVYLKVLLRVWKDDESSDLAKTMAALDKDLGRAEQFANLLGF